MNRRSLLGSLGLLWLSIYSASPVLAQNTPKSEAICDVQFGWMNNSLPTPQSPCLVAAYLEGNCGTGYWNIPALPTGQTYNGPSVNQTNVCLCSTVVYNAVSACDACQDESWVTWPNWKLNCDASVVTVGTYVVDIPVDTAVPKWMYQDPTQNVGNTFNVTLAKLQAGLHEPDITATNQASTIPTKSGSKAPIGAIVGGVIGGLAFLVIVALVIWFVYQRRLRSRASNVPSKRYVNEWSRGVVNGPPAPPSRWGGPVTSNGGSVMGDTPSKEDSMMMGIVSPEIPYGQRTSFPPMSQSPPGSTAYRTSGETGPMSPTYGGVPGYQQSMPASSRATHGHQREGSNSHSSSKARKAFGFGSSPPQSSAITPFILPPLGSPPPPTTTHEQSVDHSHSSQSQSGRTGGARTPFSMSNDTSFSPASVPTTLPSKIEYLGDRRPPTTLAQPIASQSNLAALDASTNASRSSFNTTGRGQGPAPGYYNPDDPSTYPLGDYYVPQPSRRPSMEGTALGSSTFMPQTPADKVPRGGIVHNQQQSPTSPQNRQHFPPPVPPIPTSATSTRNPAPLNMDMSLAGSVHTLPYSASPAGGPHQQAPPRLETIQPSPPPTQTVTRGAFMPDGQWTPHVPQADAEQEFDPWRR